MRTEKLQFEWNTGNKRYVLPPHHLVYMNQPTGVLIKILNCDINLESKSTESRN